MATAEVSLFATWAILAVALVAAAGWGVPLVARIGFVNRIDELRDRAVDKVLAGELPIDSLPVREFVEVLDALSRSSRHLTIARMVAYEAVWAKAGIKPRKRPSFAELDAEQRKVMHAFERELVNSVRSYLLWGSPVGYVSFGVMRCVSPFLTKTPVAEVSVSRTEIAKDTIGQARAEISHTSASPLGNLFGHDGHLRSAI